jgi:hypothetical protein
VAVGDDDPNSPSAAGAVLVGRIQLELFMKDCPKVRRIISSSSSIGSVRRRYYFHCSFLMCLLLLDGKKK